MCISESDLLAVDSQTTIINAATSAGKREIRGAIRYRPSDLLDADHLALPIARDTLDAYEQAGGATQAPSLEQVVPL